MRRTALGFSLACLAWGWCAGAGAGADIPASTAADSVNLLAIEMLHSNPDLSKNHCNSPYSLASALALTCVGARSQTADQLARTLHCSTREVASVYGGLEQALNSGNGDAPLKLHSANRLWSSARFEPEFLKLARDHFRAEPGQLNFSHPEEARKTINSWVSQQTLGKIVHLLQPEDVTPETELVLTNAVYFHGDWLSPFDQTKTASLPFHRDNGSQVRVPTMCQSGLFGAAGLEDDSLLRDRPASPPSRPRTSVVELPYQGQRLGLVLIMPAAGTSLATYCKQLTLTDLHDCLAGLESQVVALEIPRFTLHSRRDLSPTLAALAPAAFSGKADLTGALGEGGRGVRIAKVVQEATMTTDEKGSEATASTGMMSVRSLPRRLALNRPFLFLVVDHQTGVFLFMGQVADPAETATPAS